MKFKILVEIFVDKNNVNNKVILILVVDFRLGLWYIMRLWVIIFKC